ELMIFFGLIAVMIVALLIYKLSGVLTPFLVAFILAYMFNPLVNRLSHLRLPRVMAVIMVFIFLLGLLALLLLWFIPAVARQASHLFTAIPTAIQWLEETVVPYL